MSEFSEPPPLPPEEVLESRIEALASRAFPTARALWDEVGRGFVFVEARFYLEDSQASRTGWALYDLDRESRRAVKVISGRGAVEIPTSEVRAKATPELSAEAIEQLRAARRATPRELLRPSTIQSGGFRLVRADPGSANLFLQAYGLLAPITRRGSGHGSDWAT